MEFEKKMYVSDQFLMAVLITLSLSWLFIIQANKWLEDFIGTYVYEKKNSILFLRNKIKYKMTVIAPVIPYMASREQRNLLNSDFTVLFCV